MANINETNLEFQPNISTIICNGTTIARFNMSINATNQQGRCLLGSCHTYNDTYTCAGEKLHYFINTTIEVLWETPRENLWGIDKVTGTVNVTDTANISTVKVDGLLGDQNHEPSSNDTATNATRIRTQPGYCDGKLEQTFFAGMDAEPPTIVALDVPGDGLTGHPYTDIAGVGVKKTPEAYMYGIKVQDFNGSSVCFNVPLQGTTTLGAGKNQSKYYLYLDTNGVQTGGCSPIDNTSLTGFEYLFKYTTEIDSTNKLVETKLSLSCNNGTWISTSVPLNSDKNKACSFVGGPIFAIDAGIFGGKTDVNTSKSWRAYGTTASLGGNASNITDRSFTGESDFKGIDVDIIDCWSTEDKDNSQCNKFKQFGFSPGEFGPACTDNKDNDGDALTDCADYDCKFDPFFCASSSKYIVLGESDPNDETAPTITSKKVNDKIPTALSFIYGTDEPSNASVKYYYNDSTCGTLNATFNDEALGNADTFDDYRPQHIVDVTGLAANKTYFYKLQTCDSSDNCAVSKCINSTTATTFSNITFKIEVPSGWTIDIPSINLSNFSKNYALKASTQYLDEINITINQTNSTYAIKLVGIDIFEKQTLNLSRFITDTDTFGADANQYQAFKQKTGMDKVIVTIPTDSEDSSVQHCDDNGANCVAVTSKLVCTFKSTYTECAIPEAVGLGFSSYKSVGTTSSSPSGGGGGSSGGGGGGGGGAAGGASVVSQTQTWKDVSAGSSVTMSVAKNDLAITSIVATMVNSVTSLEIKATGYGAKPEGVSSISATAYQYLELTTTAQKADFSGATISFTVDDTWLKQKNIAASTVALYRYSDGWTKLSTTYEGLSGNTHTFAAETPGFSYFAIAGEQGTAAVAQPITSEVTGAATQPVEEVAQVQSAAVAESGKGAMFFVAIGLIGLSVLIIAVVLARRRNY
ncbi:PGF-pre-PGF domain-containing protein [Candidatus Woesearchaeota archaeon]|nr:PGF-pre-PGF domain-containing protein [Candidatus Woesearchaeota archaeon]